MGASTLCIDAYGHRAAGFEVALESAERRVRTGRIAIRAAGGRNRQLGGPNPRGRDIVVQVNGYSALDASYQALLPVVRALDDGAGWRSTRCAGWTVRDLVHHLLADAQRALVALHTPACGPTDVDAVSYWRAWQPDTPGADAGRRGTRIMASAWSSVEPIAALYMETATAVLVAGREKIEDDLVATQGHVMTVDTLFRTLAVEATVHHLDLRLGEPSEAGLAETRRVLDGLLGQRVPIADARRYALVGTGREPLTGEEAHALGTAIERLPVFG